MNEFIREHGMPTEIVSGTQRGADILGEMWAIKHGVPIKRFFPDWESYEQAAGPIRNAQMAYYGDALVAIWDGKSPGTSNMIRCAKKAGIPFEVRVF